MMDIPAATAESPVSVRHLDPAPPPRPVARGQRRATIAEALAEAANPAIALPQAITLGQATLRGPPRPAVAGMWSRVEKVASAITSKAT